jgi:hypothetical protein
MSGPKMKMPALVKTLAWSHDAWIVGSRAKPPHDKGNDWDVIITPSSWIDVAPLLMNGKPNSFGGWTITENNEEIDVWPSTIEQYIARLPRQQQVFLFHPKTNLVTQEDR